MKNRVIALLLLLSAPSGLRAEIYDPALAGRTGVVLLANRNTPEGVELARAYAASRGVPDDHLVILDLPVGETISRGDFERRLRDPLLEILRDRKVIEQVRRDKSRIGPHDSGWTTVLSSMRYLVPFYGVPLRVDDTQPWPLEKLANLVNQGLQRDEAAVDSELCLILQETYELRGRLSNPFYNQLRWEGSASPAHFLLVSRLDGPTPDVVRRMMQDALHAERRGLQGRVYVDERAAHADEYQVGDVWMEDSVRLFLREGYEVVVDRTDPVLGDLYPMDNAAIYLGWYAEKVCGPFLRTNFAFRAGAIAYHNHSSNARVLRTGSNYWTGPLLAKGAAVSVGAVSEPLLPFTPQLPIVMDRLIRGLPWADSVYLSLSALSWQTTVIGDPLYRPFALSLDEQIKALEEAGDPDADWAHIRRINQLASEGRLNIALRYARERLRLRESYLIREKMGDLFVLNEMFDEAVTNYDIALKNAPNAEAAARLGARYLHMLAALNQKEKATEVDKALRERWVGDRFLNILPALKP